MNSVIFYNKRQAFTFFWLHATAKLKLTWKRLPHCVYGVWQACSSHQQGFQKAFSILAESDAGVHPATWSSEMAALKGKHSVELFEWKPHEPA